jgi:hypothetical protein
MAWVKENTQKAIDKRPQTCVTQNNKSESSYSMSPEKSNVASKT